MANDLWYGVDVLASNPTEINQIEERLKQPSTKLLTFVATQWGQPVSKITKNLKDLVSFQATRNLGYLHASVNKARQFSQWFCCKSRGIVYTHLLEVSEDFPAAIFLLEYWNGMASYSGKQVIRGGQVIQELFDGPHKAQTIDWCLVDIFAPFRAEYECDLDFGSLWQEWLRDMAAATKRLAKKSRSRHEEDIVKIFESPKAGPASHSVTR